MMKSQVIVVSAGTGDRFGGCVPKNLVLLDARPIIVHSLQIFSAIADISSIVLVVHKNYLAEYKTIVDQYDLQKVVHVVVGGSSRSESVLNGLSVVDKDTEIVLVHDGARPLVDGENIKSAMRAAYENSGVVLAVPVKSTLKQVDSQGKILQTLNRNEIWEIQTPQIFKTDILKQALTSPDLDQASDDSYLVEQLGCDVFIVQGSYKNIKVTTAEDLLFAEAVIQSNKSL